MPLPRASTGPISPPAAASGSTGWLLAEGRGCLFSSGLCPDSDPSAASPAVPGESLFLGQWALGRGPYGTGPLTESSSRLFLQLPLSSSHLNVYSGDPQVTASLVGVTSSSCPADLTQKRELTGTAPLSPGAPPIPAVSPPRLPSQLSSFVFQMLRAGPWPRSGRRKTITTSVSLPCLSSSSHLGWLQSYPLTCSF